MIVFLAWSQERSRKLAEVLREWLKCVIQPVSPWMSDEDIGKGERWTPELEGKLVEAQFGIVFVTPENYKNAWLHFEAGALSKAFEKKARVCPYLLDLKKSEVTGPLTMFQMATTDKDDTLRLVQSVNETLDRPIDRHTLRECFEQFWPKLESQIAEIVAQQASSSALSRRTPEEMLEEIVTAVRTLPDAAAMTQSVLAAVEELLANQERLGWHVGLPDFSWLGSIEQRLALGRLERKGGTSKGT